MTDATATILWQLKATDAPAPVTEYAFAKSIGRRWRFDLAWPDRLVAAEIDGGSWIQGRHNTGTGFEADCEKMSHAAALGYRVLRLTPRMIREGMALTLILAALEWRAAA